MLAGNPRYFLAAWTELSLVTPTKQTEKLHMLLQMLIN